VSSKPDKAQPTYGIGTVAKMTGLTDHTIRVWERRYRAVVAERADNGRRQYTASDVEKLGLLKRLTDEGVAISTIAHLTSQELRSRTQSLRQMQETDLPVRVDAAILGDFLPLQLAELTEQLLPIRLTISDNSVERFVADLKQHPADVVVIESNVLDNDIVASLQNYMRKAEAQAGVIVYKFGSSKDVERARDLGVHLLRAPADIDSVRATILRAGSTAARIPKATPNPQIARSINDLQVPDEFPRRRFTATQLAKLTKISTAIDCECPSQLAALVNELTAFEVYSDNCANKNEDDERLHRYLHYKTAEERAIVEEALQQVVLTEGLTV